mgnify:CR=1 FL=1
MRKAILSWSGGKDSALALHELRQDPHVEIVALLTTLTEGYDRVSMHGIRSVLVEKQADGVGLPLEKVYIPQNSSNSEYETRMKDTLTRLGKQGVTCVAFGDIFLEDLRRYREEKLAEVDMEAIFPIWKRDTGELSRSFVDLGFEALLTCVDSQMLDGAFAGRAYGKALLSELPAAVDPCGENGEFHTFVHAGPVFRRPVPHEKGEVVLRDSRFYFCDVLPA